MKIPFAVWLQALLYTAAGINHFWHPEFYVHFIPPYLPSPEGINLLSGIIEIVLGISLLFKRTRKPAAWAIVLLLMAFIPAHIYLIQISRCDVPGFCLARFAAWIRLIPGQPLLIAWAYSLRNV